MSTESLRERAHVLVTRYRAFMSQPVVQRFVKDGGRVFAATEGRAAADILALLSAGHRHFAEKFVQETELKWSHLPRSNVTLHGFGRLQRNKTGRACRLFDSIESLGRDALLAKLIELRRSGIRLPPFYLQVNVGGEPQKEGYSRAAAAGALEAARLAGLDIRGVMAIPPRGEDPTRHFRWLRRFAEQEGLRECVMGMSQDFTVAIDEGATAIRIGRALFIPQRESAGPLRSRRALPPKEKVHRVF